MNIRLFILSLCFLIGNLQAMEQIPELIRQARPDNPHTNLFALQHGHLIGTHIENQHIHHSSNQEFTEGRPFLSEMLQGLRSGGKQAAFDIGHCPGTFINYGIQIATTIAATSILEFLKERIMYFWNKQELAKQKDQQQLDRLLSYYGILQNLIKEHPRTTEDEREEFRKLLEQKVILTKKLGARLAAHMTQQENDLTTPVTA
jgi:hypothetical protein